MAKKRAKGNAQANIKKEEVISTDNATAEDPQATTSRNAKTGKEKGTSMNLRPRGANKGDKVVDGIDGSEAATEKEKSISTENAAAQDPQATTEDANTEKEEGTSRGKGKEVVGVGDKAKGNNPSEVKEEPNAEGPISPWTRSANGRMVRNEGATTSGGKGKGKEVAIVGDKADGIPLIVDLSIQRIDTPEEAGDTPRTRDSGETVSVKLGSAVNEGDEIAGVKKGIDGSEGSKKANKKKPAVQEVEAAINNEEKQSEKSGNAEDGEGLGKSKKRKREENVEVRRGPPRKAATSTSAKAQEVEAVVNNEENQSEKSGNAEDGEGLRKSKKRKREENVEVRRGPPRKAATSTSTSAKVQEVEAVVKNEEEQSEKSGNAEDGEGHGKSKKRKREENVEVRRGPPRKAKKQS